jgi:hypothetical protein
MACFSEIDTYRCDHVDQEANEWSGDIDISPWRIDPPVHQQRSFDGYYNIDQASPCQLPGDFTPHDFYLISPDTCLPYYSSPPTLYDSSSSSSSRPSPPIDSPASSFLRTPELYHRDILIPSLGTNPYTFEPDYDMHAAESCVAMPNIQRCADAQFEETFDDFGRYETVFDPQELVPEAREENESLSSTTYYHHHHHHQIPIANEETDRNNIGPYPKIEPEPEPIQIPTTRRIHRNRRAAAKQTPLLTTRSSSKITKRSSPPRRAAPSRNHTRKQSIKEEYEDEDEEEHQPQQPPLRSFPCPLSPYGCTASFSAKNEWKRHAATQHFRLGFWRCDLCTPENQATINSHKKSSTTNARKPNPDDDFNDFNRKDLFIQHVRRMHADSIPLATTTTTTTTTSKTNNNNKKTTTRKRPSLKLTISSLSTSLSLIASRCHRRTHSSPPPPSLCVFCGSSFEGGAQGLESRLEHMGKHMDARRKADLEPVRVEEWKVDEGLEGWLVGCGVLVREEGRCVLGA